ncbi:MAG: alpha/beta hydrolase [Phycisphaeraceae bacterium]|nr:alpha/beta hydrolase [Phycisphaeraceae bacterium]
MAYADLTDVKMYYESDGSGEPLILIPGLGATTEDWDPAFDVAAEKFRLIRPDLRGMGLSKAKREAYSLHHYSADLLEFMDHLKLERAHVLGISLGGIIAQRFAIDHPNRIQHLVLISCADRFGTYLQEMARMVGNMVMRFPHRLFARTMHMLGTGPAYVEAHPELLAQREAESTSVGKRSVIRQLKALMVSDPHPEDHDRITCPTLVIAGSEDVLVPQRFQKQMADRISNSRFVCLEDVGHNPLTECPQRVLPMIDHFLSTGRLQEEPAPSSKKADEEESSKPAA